MIFKEFPKIARLSREIIITEKIDGTNSSVFIQSAALEEGSNPEIIENVNGLTVRAGSRTRWVTPTDDNKGFARWVKENAEELVKLGEGPPIVTGKQVSHTIIVTGETVSQTRSLPVTKCFPVTIHLQKRAKRHDYFTVS